MYRRQKPGWFYAYPEHEPMLPLGWWHRLLHRAGFDPLSHRRRVDQLVVERDDYKRWLGEAERTGETWPASEPLESAWGIIANAYGGNWDSAPDEWRKSAEAWRDKVWHASLDRPRHSVE